MSSDDGRWAVDTSVAVASLVESHAAHQTCRSTAASLRPALAGHAAFETYSVLTRLPGPARVTPTTAAHLLEQAFPLRCWLTDEQQDDLLRRLPGLDLSGGMVYDALVAEAARLAGRTLLTRDSRALKTYAVVRATVSFVA
jgi:predicted nucleic acid-binding protein